MLYRAFRYDESTPMIVGGRYQSLGAGLSIATGAKLAAPDRTVVCYHGDGGFYYDAMELSTLAERKIKIIVIIDNNHCLYANRQRHEVVGASRTRGWICPRPRILSPSRSLRRERREGHERG